jgi:hypothetical protein
MAPKKKSKKSKSVAMKAKKTPHSKRAVKSKMPKKSAKKKTAPPKKTRSRRNVAGRGGAQVSRERKIGQEIRNRTATELGRQSGDLQGLSRAQQADSESVDELVEEGNLFEAGAVAGVEEADDSDEREVHTHEVAEDDVPDEYLDKD